MKKVLMISLDAKILDKDSRVAQRMVSYGCDQELFILVPYASSVSIDLSETVHVYGIAGISKWITWLGILHTGMRLCRAKSIDIITTQDPFWLGFVGVLLILKSKSFLEVQLHGDFWGSDYYKNLGIIWRIKLLLGWWVLHRAHRIRVVGERIRHGLLRLGFDASCIMVQPVAHDVPSIASAEIIYSLRQQWKQYDKIFLVVGRLDPVKHIPWLIDVFRDASQGEPLSYGLLIIGDGIDRACIEARIHEYSLHSSICLLGAVDNPFPYYAIATALLFPSQSEGYGLVVQEAILSRCPVIMNDVGVANFEVTEGSTVQIIPTTNRNAWIHAIRNI